MLKNLTPHAVTINLPAGETRTLPKGEIIPRLVETTAHMGWWEQTPLISKKMGEIENLPEPEAGTAILVSLLVAQVAWSRGRRDVLAVGNTIRDKDGRIVGCDSLSCHPEGFIPPGGKLGDCDSFGNVDPGFE